MDCAVDISLIDTIDHGGQVEHVWLIQSEGCSDCSGSFEYDLFFDGAEASKKFTYTASWDRTWEDGFFKFSTYKSYASDETVILDEASINTTECICHNVPQEDVAVTFLTAPYDAERYQFTTRNPPLTSHHLGDPLSIRSEQLRSDVHASTWTTNNNVTMPWGGFNLPTRIETHYNAKRYQVWALSPDYSTYAVDVKVRLSQYRGYEREVAEKFRQKIGVEVGGSFSGLSAKVKGELEFTESELQRWKENTTETLDYQFKAGRTYVTWVLSDVVEIEKTSYYYSRANNNNSRVPAGTLVRTDAPTRASIATVLQSQSRSFTIHDDGTVE